MNRLVPPTISHGRMREMGVNDITREIESIIPSKCDLTNEDLVEMIQKNVEPMKNMEILYAKNIKFIISLVNKFSNSGLDFMDLLQEGYFGFFKAVNKFSPDKGYKFTTYCKWWIYHSIERYVQNNRFLIRLPVYQQEQLCKYTKFINQYIIDTGKEPTDDLVKEKLHFTTKDLKLVKTCYEMSSCASLDASTQTNDELSLYDSLPSTQDVEEEVLLSINQQEMKKELWKEIDSLSSEDAFLIKQVFKNNKTITEVASSLGISQQVASNRLKKLLCNLRKNEKIRMMMNQYGKASEKVMKKEKKIISEKPKTQQMMELEKMFADMNENIFKGIEVI